MTAVPDCQLLLTCGGSCLLYHVPEPAGYSTSSRTLVVGRVESSSTCFSVSFLSQVSWQWREPRVMVEPRTSQPFLFFLDGIY